MSKEDVEAGITGEITVASQLSRPMAGLGSSAGTGAVSGEIADFFREFDKRMPNLHPERHFWEFNGPLVSFGDFWVPSDCVPYLQRLIAEHGNFVTNFKLSARLGGPMLSLLSSVLAAMSKSDLGTVTKVQILAWRSVVQDLMEVGFDLGFMIEHLRQITQRLFGKKISDEVQALQHQIAFLLGSLAVLTAYQEEMMSTGGTVLGFEYSRSLFDSLFN